RLLSLFGLAWNIKVPTAEAQAQARRNGVDMSLTSPEVPGARPDVPVLPAPGLMLIFWMLLGAASGINLLQIVWHVFGWEVGEISIAVPVGGGVGALVGILLGLVRDPRMLVLVLAVF